MSVHDLPVQRYVDGQGRPQQCPALNRFFDRWATCKRRDCPRCGVGWAASQEVRSRVNLAAYGGPVALISITAPGAKVLPWSCTKKHVHSGKKGCRVEDEAADRWAERLAVNYRKLRDAAYRATKRAGYDPRIVLERVWEPQKRGVPHAHLVVGVGSPEALEAARVFVAELHRLAPEHFFGFVDRKLAPITAREAARYLASYLTGRSGKKGSIRENLADARMPRSLVWITPRLTSETHCTMRRLRVARWVRAVLSGHVETMPSVDGEEADRLAALLVTLDAQSRRGPPDELAERRYRKALEAMKKKRDAERYLTTLGGRPFYRSREPLPAAVQQRCEACGVLWDRYGAVDAAARFVCVDCRPPALAAS